MAKPKKDVILIPWDFTEASEVALQHAVQLAKEVNNHIMLARFVESPGLFAGKSKKQAVIDNEKEKLKKVGESVLEKYGINPYIAVELGYSISVVKNLVNDAKANLVILGKTYKINDKLVLTTKEFCERLKSLDIPFVVAEKAPAHSYYKEIVVPLDQDKHFKETLQMVVFLSKYYNCNINIIKPYIDDELEKKDMTNNIYFTKKMLDKKNIIYGIKTAKKNRKFEDEVFRFAENIDSDLIVMMVRKYIKYISEHPNYESSIPIMVINRNSQIVKYGGFR